MFKSLVRCYSTALPNKQTVLPRFTFPVANTSISLINKNLSKYLNNKHEKITLNGHINRKPRIRSTLGFVHLRDENGDEIQLFATPNTTSDAIFKLLKEVSVEDSISVSGYIQSKESKANKQEVELVIEDFHILNPSNLEAARLEKLKQSSPKDIPPQFRYLQLRTPFFQNALRTRSKISKLIRDILIENHNFVEIETPLLFKSTPEGAREFLVPTRSSKFYALPQSPQQYKQILMSSGFTKYFQLAKCFRDEDLRSDRQPEFTQIDLEMSFINNSDQIGLVVEDLIHNIWNKIGNKSTYKVNSIGNLERITNFDGLQFEKLDYIDALTKYGIDKPDLRYNLEFENLQDYFVNENNEFPIVEACILRNAGHIPKSFTDGLNFKRKPFVWMIKNEEDKLIQNKVKGIYVKNANYNLDLNIGDVIAISTRSEFPYENPTPLGKFRQLTIQEFPDKYKRPIEENGKLITNYNHDVIVGSWVVNFPLFNPVELESDIYPKYDYTKFQSTHHPFTMCKIEDYDLLETDPLKVRGEHYDLVINGVEIGGGSRRIHDSELQNYIFRNILKINNIDELFGHLLKALSMGCPPHAGLAIGFDRLCAMIIGSSSIKDVIAFPKNQSGVDPVVDSPTQVNREVLSEYHITVNK
ncbi:unnamed protein product [Candida verbasci]|uniref:Aminoacyl-transfer RNA synthetases class-II family profile domain-containing protein n=1 Tax=Candida verbasci TaxID=1227364 RepID=A0A9W4XG99_9ASCO|nr:unnamed protein product [Candida verbasci]